MASRSFNPAVPAKREWVSFFVIPAKAGIRFRVGAGFPLSQE